MIRLAMLAFVALTACTKPEATPRYSPYMLHPEVDYCAKVKIVKGRAYQECWKRFADGSTYHRSGI